MASALRRRAFHDDRISEVLVGRIDVSIACGFVTLEAEVPSLAHRGVIGVFGWWTPGTGNVVDNLSVRPPEKDSDKAPAEAVRLVLEKDQRIYTAGIRVGVRSGVVTREGTVLEEEEERAIVERAAWYVFGVEDLVSQLAVTGWSVDDRIVYPAKPIRGRN